MLHSRQDQTLGFKFGNTHVPSVSACSATESASGSQASPPTAPKTLGCNNSLAADFAIGAFPQLSGAKQGWGGAISLIAFEIKPRFLSQ
jgi:hypothetical protein